MPYTPLAAPFNINFVKDDVEHEATVTYVKSSDCCSNFFNVVMHKPGETPAFILKEKPGIDPEYDNMVWMDEHDKINMLYQYIGAEIEKHLKTDLNIFFIDAHLSHKEADNGSPEHFD
jgi:hypothetical protein